VLELYTIPCSILGCYAHAAVLDRIGENEEASVRVAADELLVIGARHRLADVESELAALDAASVVIDLSSAFAIWVLRGEERFEAFRRLSAIELPAPPAVAQGLVAHVPAKVLVNADQLVVIVSSVLAHHLRERVLRACADLAPSERAAVELEEAPV
jgi:hypothetical protein